MFEQELEKRTPSDYYCVETTYRGGAAILWRIDPVAVNGPGRFSREQTSLLTTGKKVPLYVGPTGACAVPPSPTSGNWYALALRLKDNGVPSSPKYVNVASMHLKTGGEDCAWQNMKLLNSELAVGPVNMQIMAGDTNHADAAATDNHNTFGSWECWYRGMNAGLGMCEGGISNFNWQDVMDQKWIAGTSEPSRYGLTHAYEWSWSHHWPDPPVDNDRRDFLFTRTYSIANDANQPNQQPRTVPWEDAGGTQPRYSDHRGLGALLRYCAGSTLTGCSGGA